MQTVPVCRRDRPFVAFVPFVADLDRAILLTIQRLHRSLDVERTIVPTAAVPFSINVHWAGLVRPLHK